MKSAGWGNYPTIEANLLHGSDPSQISAACNKESTLIARGLGRSYGDSALAPTLFLTDQLNQIRHFDTEKGLIQCQSGVSLQTIIQQSVPNGWFLGVTPGTQFVTVGGAIASDVHGKNHHHVGSFSEFVISLDLLTIDGQVITCSRDQNSELFFATCGGMGLTGIIIQATLQLIPISSALISQKTFPAYHIQELIELCLAHHDAPYSVAWLDCTASGKSMGKSLLMIGKHANHGSIELPIKKPITMPFYFPAWLLNKWTVRAFNKCYFANHKAQQTCSLIDYFYPLDQIKQWNRFYGKAGFLQYQFVIPLDASKEGLTKMLKRIVDYGKGSFLSVLKLLGKQNRNLLSFPLRGFTLALDFKYEPALLPFLNELDNMVVDYGGRVYLAKDARLSSDTFQQMYPEWMRFSEIRKKVDPHHKLQSLQSKRLGL